MDGLALEINNKGFVIVDDFFDYQQIVDLEDSLFELGAFDYKNSEINTSSLLNSCRSVYEFANSPRINQLLKVLGNDGMFPVKAFILDKTKLNNWAIPWHQDLKIAVDKRLDVNGYSNWSVEAGIIHVQPPAEVMSRLITLRLHLDNCDRLNGAINVIPGSHHSGIIPKGDIPQMVDNSPKVLCTVKRFGAMFMNPLILHDSPPSLSNTSRRILQIEYGYDLGNGLGWH